MTPAPSVIFRVDAEPAIGLGHLARCRTLASAFTRAGARCSLLTATPDEVARRAAGLPVLRLAGPIGSRDDARETARAARDASLVVVDGYRFGEAFAEALDAPEVLWIDDGGFEGLRPGRVLNHNLYASAELYASMDPARLLLGPGYALIREEFRSASAAPRRSGPPGRVLVTMGGSDPAGVTAKVLDALSRSGARDSLTVRALVGELNPRREHLLERTDVDVVVAPPEVAPHMRWADVIVGAAGGTAMELCCVGVPAIVVAAADNQVPVAEALARLELARSLGWHADLRPEAVAGAVEELLASPELCERMRARQREIVDGRGPDRVVAALGAFT